ncbi:uncharacterized protein [Branchiostoma lanceolatum]|uniref:uncharacterized protein n=1 Tax=Branchiostoma lanceolatum TaxID=7740 RepID=UPI003457143A
MNRLLLGLTALLVAAAFLRMAQSNPCRSVPASTLTCEDGTRSNGDTCTLCTRTGGEDPGMCWEVPADCQAGDGASYRGAVSVTMTGKTCQRWDSQTPHAHFNTPANYPSSGLEQNYCRNPDGATGVWCYTTDPSTTYEYCDIRVCDDAETVRWLDIPASYLVDWWEQTGSVTSAEGAIDCDFGTWWQSPVTLLPPNKRHWLILDLQTIHNIYEISIENHNWDIADVGSFILEASMVDPYEWQHVESSDSVQILTIATQYFGGFRGTGRYWKITMWTTTGYNIWVHDVCFYGHAVSAKPCPQLYVDCDFSGSPQTVADETSTGQPCHVAVDIHEGVRSKDNPLQVPRSGELTLHGLVSFNCEWAYQTSALWTMPVNDTFTDVLIDLLQDKEDVQPDRLHLYLPPKTMPLGVFRLQLQVIMRATENSHVSVGVAQTYVGFGPLPIAPTLGNAARTVDGGDFWINADESFDPDDVIPSSDFSYNWTCEVVYLPDPTPLECIDVLDDILIYGGSRYKVYTTSKSAADASTECKKEAGHLASPNDADEWAAILRLNDCVGGQTRTIGVMDEDGDGQWSLSDGTDVTWSAWAPGYPSAPAAGACAQVTSDGWSDDISCVSQNEFICELSISDDCRVEGQLRDYVGQVNTTLEGRDCQAWDTNSPHNVVFRPTDADPGNKCRDPAGDGYLWCYTADPAKRWEQCPVPSCGT